MPSRRAFFFVSLAVLFAILAVATHRWRRTGACVTQTVTHIERTKPAFPLHLEAGHRYLVDRNGLPFLIYGDAAWSLVAQVTREQAETYLEDRRRRGFNLVLVNLIEHRYADHAPLNAYGQAPFLVAGDFSTPSDTYFSYAEWLVTRAAAKGFVVLLCPAYLGGDGGPDGWYQEMVKNGVSKLRAYGEYVGSLFRKFDNVIWINGGDFTPPALNLTLVDAVAEGIKGTSPQQLQTAHFSPETSGTDVKVSGWVDLNTTYTYEPVYLRSLVDYRRDHSRPHFLVESNYEAERDSTPSSIRGQAYYALLTGAAGQVFGNRWVWQFTSPNPWRRLLRRTWTTALDSPGARSMSHVRELFDGLDWTSLVPDDTYEVLVGGQTMKGTLEYAVLAWDRNGRIAVVYLPTVRDIAIDLGRLSGPIRARWFDPTRGTFIDVAGSPLNAAGVRQFRPLGKNAAGDTDWILLLEKAI